MGDLAMRQELPGQLELPQTEERPADLARIKTAEPLKPAKEQKPCDIGLFSDDAKQTSLC